MMLHCVICDCHIVIKIMDGRSSVLLQRQIVDWHLDVIYFNTATLCFTVTMFLMY